MPTSDLNIFSVVLDTKALVLMNAYSWTQVLADVVRNQRLYYEMTKMITAAVVALLVPMS